MSSHRLPSSFSEQSYGLNRHYRLPGSFSEQINDTNSSDFLIADEMVDESRKNVPKLANQSRKHKPIGQVSSSVDVNRDSRPSQKRYCDQFLSSSEVIKGPDPALEVINLTVNVEHCAICSNVLGQG
jgi:hypothetical protein